MAPGPVQCKGFANMLHYRCNIHHGHFLNVVAGFWLVDKPFSDCWPCCHVVQMVSAPTINTIGTRASAGCVLSLLDVVKMACVEVCACMSVGMCDELWYITGTFLLCKPQQKLLKLLLSCVWQVCTQDDYDLCLSTSSLGKWFVVLGLHPIWNNKSVSFFNKYVIMMEMFFFCVLTSRQTSCFSVHRFTNHTPSMHTLFMCLTLWLSFSENN